MMFLLLFLSLLPVYGLTQRDDFWNIGTTGAFRGQRHNPNSNKYAAISEAGHLAFVQCQRHFEWDRWNCSKNTFLRWGRKLGAPLTREMAYLDALVTSSIAYVINRDCAINSKMKQKITFPDGDCWDWSLKTVDKYIIHPNIRRGDIQTLANAHNANVGKRIIRETLKKSCKCHGMSGTCSFRTCWHRMAPLAVIADKIRREYHSAVLIGYEGGLGGFQLGNSAAADAMLDDNRVSQRLVYLRRSPDYCKPDPPSGWTGIDGRLCWRSDSDVKPPQTHCRVLCRQCGYKVRRTTKDVKKYCNCRIVQFYRVECDNCTEIIKERFCVRQTVS